MLLQLPPTKNRISAQRFEPCEHGERSLPRIGFGHTKTSVYRRRGAPKVSEASGVKLAGRHRLLLGAASIGQKPQNGFVTA